MLDDLTKLAKQKYVAPYFFAGVHIGLGENDRAMEYLEKSYEEHSHWLIYLQIDPSMDGLRDNPRFQDLSRRVDRKSTRLNSSHSQISYAVFCLKKKSNPR